MLIGLRHRSQGAGGAASAVPRCARGPNCVAAARRTACALGHTSVTANALSLARSMMCVHLYAPLAGKAHSATLGTSRKRCTQRGGTWRSAPPPLRPTGAPGEPQRAGQAAAQRQRRPLGGPAPAGASGAQRRRARQCTAPLLGRRSSHGETVSLSRRDGDLSWMAAPSTARRCCRDATADRVSVPYVGDSGGGMGAQPPCSERSERGTILAR